MLVRRITLLIILLISLLLTNSLYAAYRTCDISFDIDGLPSSAVPVSAGDPVTWEVTITSGGDHEARNFNFVMTTPPSRGTVETSWERQSGHVGVLSLTYTPRDSYSEGDLDQFQFHILDDYLGCITPTRRLDFFEESCNGSMQSTYISWSTHRARRIAWGGSYGFQSNVDTRFPVVPPEYDIVLLNDTPNLGTFELTSVGDVRRSSAKRLNYTYTHSEVSSGSDRVEFMIVDNAIADPEDREACGIELFIPISINSQPDNYYCDGLDGELEISPSIIDVGETVRITVQGTPGDRSSGEYIYTLTGTLSNGDIPGHQAAASAPTSGDHYYDYTHDGGNDGADVIAVTITDAHHTECSVVRNISIPMVDHCASIVATSPDVAPIDVGSATNFTINVRGGSGEYRYRVISGVENGSITGPVDGDSGWVTQDSFEFDYQHDARATEGDVVVVEVVDRALERYGCAYRVNVPIQLINYCEGFGIGDGSTTLIVIEPGGRGVATIHANAGAGSGSFIYNVDVEPTRGDVSPLNSGVTSATSFDFTYEHDGSTFTDSFVVSVQDAVYTQCIEQVTVNVEFVDYCETFYGEASPISRVIDVGGSYGFTVSGNGGSGQYRYTISRLPVHGDITSGSTSVESSGEHEFTYTHDLSHPNDGDVIDVLIEDRTYSSCSETIRLTMRMPVHCSSITYRINNPYSRRNPVNNRGVNEEINVDITVVGGSGNYDFNITSYDHLYSGTLEDAGETIDGDTYIKHYTYTQPTNGDSRFYFRVYDNEYTDGRRRRCSSHWLDSRYTFDGEAGNDACHTKSISSTVIRPLSRYNYAQVGEVVEFAINASGYDSSREYSHFIVNMPSLGGSLVRIGEGSRENQMLYRYTAPINATGYDDFTLGFRDSEDTSCEIEQLDFRFGVSDASNTCNGSTSGADADVIIDNTASGVEAIATNLKFMSGCNKEQTTIGTKRSRSSEINGQGANVINIQDYQIVSRHANPDRLQVHVGALNEDGLVDGRRLLDSSRRLNYFVDGEHLFDLGHLRATANWLSGSTDSTPNVIPRSTAAGGLVKLDEGTYGTITMRQFLKNIRDGKVMYGVVRVVIGLEKGTCGMDCATDAYNGIGVPTDESELYGFCGEATRDGLCACAPSTRRGRSPAHHFASITPGEELCEDEDGNPIILPDDAKIMVKGSLLWDFVDFEAVDDDGNPEAIPLENLPFFPRELYFMVNVPVVVNSAYDGPSQDYCGGIDYHECSSSGAMSRQFLQQAEYINSITSGISRTTAMSSRRGLDFRRVPQVSKTYYEIVTGDTLTSTLYRSLPLADQYHALMPSGYAEGWADAFKQLQVTAGEWEALGYVIPDDVDLSETLSVEDVHNNETQDVPVYLYSGGLVDMHSHVNISGLVYVPQALEMEAETGPDIRQMIMGALIVKDGFFIQGKNDSITIISNYGSSYSSIKTANPIIRRRNFVGSGLENLDYDDSGDGGGSGGGTEDCLYCPRRTTGGGGSGGVGGGGGGGGGGAGNLRFWQQVVPDNAP